MSAATDAPEEVRPETKKIPGASFLAPGICVWLTPPGTEAPREEVNTPRLAPYPAAGNNNTRKGRGATRERRRLTPETEASHAGNGSATRGGQHPAPRTLPRRRKRERHTPRRRKQRRPAAVVRRGVADGAESVVRLTVRATSSRRASVPSSRRAAPDPSA